MIVNEVKSIFTTLLSHEQNCIDDKCGIFNDRSQLTS